MKFSDLALHPALQKAIEAKGYADATTVQEAVLDPAHETRDLLVSSQTGSGKTLAFGLATAAAILNDDVDLKKKGGPLVLAVAPTRELAQQVASELGWLYRGAGVRVATCVGGMDIRREQRALDFGVHIVVGTPGRVCDHLDRKSLDLSRARAVVLDEADEMLDMGFREELEKILEAAPADRRTLMFSATFPKHMEALARKFTKDPARIAASKLAEPHADITYLGHLVAPREREHAVVNVLRAHDAATAMVFCATRDGVAHLTSALMERGFLTAALSGELSQAERNRAIHAVREGRARVLVATDVAARGIDLPAVSLVVHADLPQNTEALLHRSGRTGRAGKKGTAVLLVPFMAKGLAERMLRTARVTGQWTPVPTVDAIRALDNERLLRDVGALVAEGDSEDLDVAKQLLEKFPAEQIASALVKLERRALPAAEELPMTMSGKAPPRPSRDDHRAVASAAQRQERGRPYERGEGREGPRPPRPGVGSADGAWFRVNVGRDKNADPKWLVPMLCRRMGARKADIGRIEIGAKETRFEVNPKKADFFADNAAKPDAKDPKVRIEPV